MSSKIKIQIILNHTKYKKDQIIEVEEKEAISLLTNGKAIRVRKLQEEKPKKEKIKKNDI